MIGIAQIALSNGASSLAVAEDLPRQVTEIKNFHIPAQSLSSALATFAQQSGRQISYDPAIAKNVSTNGVSGVMTPEAALSSLLNGTPVQFHRLNAHTLILERKSAANITLGPVRVGGTTNVINEQITSEGSGSYTSESTVGKIAQSLRHTPQSVSIITRQRIEDQNLTSLYDVLDKTVGITAQTYGWGASYLSRGYSLQLQMDGMSSTGTGDYAATFDTAMYDRVEVMRGPAGMFNGSSSPGGTVNLARKRPTREFAVQSSVAGGSWSHFHGDIDLNTPLTPDGRVRARVVVAGDSSDSFVDRVHNQYVMAYGIIAANLDPDTVLSLSGTYQYHLNSPVYYGVPTYKDGSLIMNHGYFSGITGWTRMNQPSGEFYGDLVHHFNSHWIGKLAVRYAETGMKYTYGYLLGAIDSSTNKTSFFATSGNQPSHSWNADANIAGDFKLFGQEHQMVFGSDMYYTKSHTSGARGQSFSDVYAFDPDVTEPSFLPGIASAGTTWQYGIYGKGIIHPIRNLSLIGGGRMSWYSYDGFADYSAAFGTDKYNSNTHQMVSTKITPYGGIVYDFTKNLSWYGSYTDIFLPQTATTYQGKVLPPRIGDQWETGMKGEFYKGALNASFAFFRMRDRNRSYSDPAHPGFSLAQGLVQSQGFETEVTGKLYPGLDLSTGYTYLQTKYLEDSTKTGANFSPMSPKHTFKFWVHYAPTDNILKNWIFGVGIKAISKYRSAETIPVKSKGYVTLATDVGYKINKHFDITLMVNNITNKKYYETTNQTGFGNYYGQPRTFYATLRFK